MTESATRPPGNVVAIVPAKDRADSIAATVGPLVASGRVARVVVVDDGSTDATAAAATTAGADVVRLPDNRGKGAAVQAGLDAAPEAEVVLLVDADVGASSVAALDLLDPIEDDAADLVIGALPPAAGRGGGGRVKRAARRTIVAACGWEPREPLSGQRAVRRELVDGLPAAHRFGLEVAMTIDAVRAGARVVELDVAMEHRHTGGSARGWVHRARQGADIARAAWSRRTTARQRIGLTVLCTSLLALVLLGVGSRPDGRGAAPVGTAERVVVVAVNPLDLDDLDPERTPTMWGLVDEGATGVLNVRTPGAVPDLGSAHATLGAGARVEVGDGADLALPVDAPYRDATAGAALEAATGVAPSGSIAVVGAAEWLDPDDDPAPGALADALDPDGAAAAIGVADHPGAPGIEAARHRPAALAAMDRTLSVAEGSVEPASLLTTDERSPFGIRSDPAALVAALDGPAAGADVVVVDPGDLSRAEVLLDADPGPASTRRRDRALRTTDDVVAAVLEWADDDVLVVIASLAPPGSRFRLTPVALVGPGIPAGRISSPSTQRAGLGVLTDLAPTALAALGRDVPDEMPGRALEVEPGASTWASARRLDEGSVQREASYVAITVAFIAAQLATWVVTALLLRRGGRRPGAVPVLRWAILASASVPLASFLVIAVPGWWGLDPVVAGILLAAASAAVGALATSARATPLAPLRAVLLATIGVMALDAALGSPLHVNGWLGYTLHSTGRYYGIPNSTFAVLGAATIGWICLHVHDAPRRREALVTATGVAGLVVVVDAAPTLGGDVGGLLALTPVLGLLLWHLWGRRIRPLPTAAAGLATVALLGVVAAADLARPASSRTHLGRLAAALRDDGVGGFVEVVARRQGTNVALFGVGPWGIVVLVVAVAALVGLVARPGWAKMLLPPGGDLRAAVIATLAGGLLGLLTNDSGPVVTAIFLSFLGPLLTLVALDERWGRPVEVGADVLPAGAEDARPA